MSTFINGLKETIPLFYILSEICEVIVSPVGLWGAPSSNPELWPGSLAQAFNCTWRMTLSIPGCPPSGSTFLGGIPGPCCQMFWFQGQLAFPDTCRLFLFIVSRPKSDSCLSLATATAASLVLASQLDRGLPGTEALTDPLPESSSQHDMQIGADGLYLKPLFSQTLNFQKTLIQNSHYEKGL